VTRLQVAVLLGAPPAPPPGIDEAAYRRALAGDVHDTVHNLATVHAALAVSPDDEELARGLAWPGTSLHVLHSDPASPAALVETLDALAAAGAQLAAVVAADAPDIPGLLVGKLFSALEDAPCAVCPADDGTLVALAAALPVPAWLRAGEVGLDTPEALQALHAAAPAKGVVVGPGWHRLRVAVDVARLDPGLEGWDATRSLLGG
jgi:molybdopterin-guanine dinucleotide biosynthesis protein A